MLSNAWVAVLITFALAILWLRLMEFFAHRGWIDGVISRKLIHMGTGPLFVLCWLLFPDAPESRWIAVLVPLMITAQFFMVGTGILKDAAAVKAMSRSGDRREILRGPLYYGIVFIFITILYWDKSPIGIIALMLLCGGDGVADLFGKWIASPRLRWSKSKTWAGTISMFLGGWLFSVFILWIYVSSGKFNTPLPSLIGPVTVIALAGTVVESFPYKDIDNLTVPTAAILLGHLLLP